MNEWQDISTAPKDGSKFMAFWDGEMQTAYGVIRWENDGWHEGIGPAYWTEVAGFTHWMPLPPPPARANVDEVHICDAGVAS